MQRYPFLRFATTVLRVVGWIVLIVGVIGSIAFGIVTGGVTGAFMAVGGIIGSFLSWLFLLATRELFYLLIQVEENTRNTADRITITEKSGQD
jgi:membrane associated rhomboid family serine protease